ncbi:MAG TPA: transglutaminase family protein [Solimonas sp.]
MTLLTVTHRTEYRYAQPVRFNEHRLMCRPRDSHDLRLLDTRLTISPVASVRWLHDVFGNSIAIVSFSGEADHLMFESSFDAEHFPDAPSDILIEEYARRLPFNYAAEDVSDLGRTRERHYPDPERRIDQWAKRHAEAQQGDTLATLIAITEDIKAQFQYLRREEMGTQSPIETLDLGTGSCRDFALFMIEAVRSLGLAARFVSGYLYDENLVGADVGMTGGGATHAWTDVYLPGAGWVEFDPTNALVGGRNLIRVAVARDASQAIPLTGSFIGRPGDDLGMSVDVRVAVMAEGSDATASSPDPSAIDLP